jgi:hypothetical protein
MAGNDINIAIVAKNNASAAINQVSADMTGLAKNTQAATSSFANTPQLTQGLQKTSADIRAISTSLQAAAKDAEGFNRTLSTPAKVSNAGGIEAISASSKALRAELAAILKDTEQLAKAGKLDFGAGTEANLAKVRQSIGQMRGELKNLDTASKAAAKAGILGDASGPTQALANVGRQAQTLRTALGGVSTQAKQTATDVANVGKSANLGGLKNQVAEIDGAFGKLSSVFSGGLGGAAGVIGLGATALAIGGISSAITDAVRAADQFDKLNSSFQQLAENAGQSGDAMLKALRNASSGMISDASLVQSANKAMLLGVADSAEEMVALLEVARVRGQAMGLSVTDAFNDIVTGLGRESALILDNLGITLDLDRTYKEYAETLGKTVSQLDAVERKQALVNKVMAESSGLTAAAPTGAGAALAQSQAAQANAQVAAGEFFAPLVRDAAQAYADGLALMSGNLDNATRAQRELNDAIADGQLVTSNGVIVELGPEQVKNFQELSAALKDADAAVAAGVPNAVEYQTALEGITAAALSTGRVTAQQANLAKLAASGLREETDAYTQLRAALDQLDPKLDNNRQQMQAVATAEQIAADAATLAKFSVDALTASMAPAAAAAQAMAGGLSQVQAQAGATAGIIYNLAGAMQQLQGVSNKNIAAPDALDRVLPQINNLGTSLVGGGLSPAAALEKIKELKLEAGAITREMEAQGASEEEIFLALSANVQATQKWASSLGQVSDEARAAQEQFENIQGKVAGLISEAQNLPSFKAGDLFNADELTAKGLTFDSQINIDQAANGGVRPDAINENARRLMAIAKEGLTDQSWLEEFKREVPEVFKELEGNPDIRGSALRILQEFQNGLRPELLDTAGIKDRVKQMILGEQNAAALAEEIAREIATEMGISLPQALAASREALGVGGGEGEAGADIAAPNLTDQGSAAGVSFRAGMVAGFDAKGMTGEILVKIDAEFNNPKNIDALKKSGGAVGALWGNGFLSTVGANIPPGLYDVLVSGLVPLIVAAIGTGGSRVGAVQ